MNRKWNIKEVRLPSMGTQNSVLHQLISKLRNYKVPMCLKYQYLVTKTISEETDNYSEYTQVLKNEVQSSMEIMRNHVINYRVIKHERKPGRSMPEKDKQVGRKILSSTDVLSRLDIRKILSIIQLDRLDVCNKRVQFFKGQISDGLSPHTNITGADILTNISQHLQPPVVL